MESASVPLRSGTSQANSANVMTEIATSTTVSFAQATAYVAVETATAGKDGMEMLVRSGWGLKILKYN